MNIAKFDGYMFMASLIDDDKIPGKKYGILYISESLGVRQWFVQTLTEKLRLTPKQIYEVIAHLAQFNPVAMVNGFKLSGIFFETLEDARAAVEELPNILTMVKLIEV